MLSSDIFNVVMLSVVMLNLVMRSVMVPHSSACICKRSMDETA
jgi:hypothetical protein